MVTAEYTDTTEIMEVILFIKLLIGNVVFYSILKLSGTELVA